MSKQRIGLAFLGLVLMVGAAVKFVASHKQSTVIEAVAARDIPPVCTPDFCP